jgi:hypothetical protein
MTGSVASLWQAYPGMPAREMIQVIRNTGDRFDNPDATYGYGVPSFARAFRIISSIRLNFSSGSLKIYPNPASGFVRIEIPGSEQDEYFLKLYDINGRCIRSERVSLPGEIQLPAELAPGLYIVEVLTPDRVYRNRLIIR